jgi:hypothetical protein
MNNQTLSDTKKEIPSSKTKKQYEKPSIISEHELEIHAGSPLSDSINPFDEAFK